MLSATAIAQEGSDTTEQFWPEIDVFVHVSPKVRLFFLATVTKSQETRQAFEGQVGAHVDFLVNKNLFFRTGYRRGFELGDSSESFKEHRLLLEQTYKLFPRGGLTLSDRNRVDVRWVNDAFSVRYRNRLTLEREFTLKRRSLTPYSSIEVYYDSRFDTWNRNRYAFGLQFSLLPRGPLRDLLSHRKSVILDFY